MTTKVVRLLERAIEAVQEGVPSRGRNPTIYALAKKAYAKGHKTEVRILKLAYNVVLAALRQDADVHLDNLQELHDVVCDYVDAIMGDPSDIPEAEQSKTEQPKGSTPNRLLN